MRDPREVMDVRHGRAASKAQQIFAKDNHAGPDRKRRIDKLSITQCGICRRSLSRARSTVWSPHTKHMFRRCSADSRLCDWAVSYNKALLLPSSWQKSIITRDPVERPSST